MARCILTCRRGLLLLSVATVWPALAHTPAQATILAHVSAQANRPARMPNRVTAPADSPSPVYRYAPPPLLASSAALLDVNTGRWLLLDNADTPRAQASTAKIMTALVAIARGGLQHLVPVDQQAVEVGQATGSNMGLAPGERLPLRDLLYGLLLPSGNDAALAIARYVGGTVPAFVALMNHEAALLGLTHTHYATPHGLDAPGQYSSARDLALLANAAMSNPLFRQIVATRAYVIPATATHRAHRLTNINWFVDWYPGADGVKPGMTANAGLCQVLSVHRDGHWLIGALMNTPDLHTDARDLMNYGFRDFHWTPSGQPGDAHDAAIQTLTPHGLILYFPATGHRVRAGFLDYFVRHGGAAVLGLPRTDEFVEDGVTVQYFQRARLWWDDAAQAAIATPLGEMAVPSTALLRPVPYAPTTPSSVYMKVTGHIVRGAILAAYRAWGGRAAFGYPLTEELRVGGLTIQYFSNAAFQWSPRGGVTLVPLGDDALRARGYLAR